MRTTTLAAAATDTGIRCYTKYADGEVREACHDLNLQSISDAVSNHRHDIVDQAECWFPGEFRVCCHPDSALLPLAWGSWKLSVFYQTDDNCIRERRHLGDWRDYDFLQRDAYPGTGMAGVCSRDGDRVIIFFQDSEEYICYRRANRWLWEDAVRLCKAAPGTGIAATSWNDINDIRVYYQDESNVVREYCGGFYNGWFSGEFQVAVSEALASMAAIAWPDEIRVYFEGEPGKLVEWCRSGGVRHWYRGEFNATMLPGAEIVAFVRILDPGPLINVLWATSDKLLHQQVNAPGMSWLNPTPIAFLSKTGRFVGSANGMQFNDSDVGTDDKIISKIMTRSGYLIDGISVSYKDGRSTPWHGGWGGGLSEFVLEEGEDITQVLITSSGGHIQSLVFITSNGRESPRYGGSGGDAFAWELGGMVLNGFIGSEGQYLNGLMPIWSPHQSSAGQATLDEWVHEAECLSRSTDSTRVRSAELQARTCALRQAIEEGLKPPAHLALEDVSDLVRLIVDLSRVTSEDRKVALVRRCKYQSSVVATRFQTLHEEAKKHMEHGNELTLEVTHETTITHNRIERVSDILTISAAMRVNAEKVKQLKEQRWREAEQSIRQAHETRSNAERKKSENETTRVIRDIFTFGLGEIGDWGGLNAAIDYADRLITSCGNDLQQCQASLALAENDVRAIDCQLQEFDHLKSTLCSCTPVLENQVAELNLLRENNMILANKGLDVSIFLGRLSAMSETLDINNSAREFARNILAIGAAIDAPVSVQGLLTQGEEDIISALQVIASTPAPCRRIWEDLM